MWFIDLILGTLICYQKMICIIQVSVNKVFVLFCIIITNDKTLDNTV